MKNTQTEQILKDKIGSFETDVALEVWLRDVLCAAGGMSDRLKWARNDAAELRRRADAIVAREIARLAEDIVSEWPESEIVNACKKAKD